MATRRFSPRAIDNPRLHPGAAPAGPRAITAHPQDGPPAAVTGHPGLGRPAAGTAHPEPGRPAAAAAVTIHLPERRRRAVAVLPARSPARSVLRRPPGAPVGWRRPVAAVPAAPRPAGARRLPVGALALVLVLGGLFAVGAGVGQLGAGLGLPGLLPAAGKPPPGAFPVLEPSRPLRLRIASLKVSAPVFPVGLGGDGAIEVPPVQRHNEAGWFERGPSPGQFGPAVLVGHADTRTGPSVFHDVGRLRPGERLEVVRSDRRVAVFEVTSVERFGKSALPVDRVYGDFSRPGLRLITCGGRWLGGSTGYQDNIVVFAALVSAHRD